MKQTFFIVATLLLVTLNALHAALTKRQLAATTVKTPQNCCISGKILVLLCY
jgi:hypothetical protein